MGGYRYPPFSVKKNPSKICLKTFFFGEGGFVFANRLSVEYFATLSHAEAKCLATRPMSEEKILRKKLRNSASSFHWLSSSIFTYCSSFVRSSRIGDTSSHLH